MEENTTDLTMADIEMKWPSQKEKEYHVTSQNGNRIEISCLYPVVNWEALQTLRIPACNKHCRQVLVQMLLETAASKDTSTLKCLHMVHLQILSPPTADQNHTLHWLCGCMPLSSAEGG